MPYRITVHETWIHVEFSGVVRRADLDSVLAELEAMEANPGPSLHRLTDTSQVTRREIDWTAHLDAGQRRAQLVLKNPIRSAIVATTPLQVGSARSYETLNAHPQIEYRLFESPAEALAWLSAG